MPPGWVAGGMLVMGAANFWRQLHFTPRKDIKKMPPPVMTVETALAMARLVLEFESETTTARLWRAECKQAAQILAEFSPPPPEWVERTEAGPHSNFNIPAGDNSNGNSYTPGFVDGRKRTG